MRLLLPLLLIATLAGCSPDDGICGHPEPTTDLQLEGPPGTQELSARYVEAWEAASGAEIGPFRLLVAGEGSFPSACSPTGWAAGVAVVEEGLIVVAWPMLALPHELTHLWLYRHGYDYSHAAFGAFWAQVIREARAEVER